MKFTLEEKLRFMFWGIIEFKVANLGKPPTIAEIRGFMNKKIGKELSNSIIYSYIRKLIKLELLKDKRTLSPASAKYEILETNDQIEAKISKVRRKRTIDKAAEKE